MLKFDNSPLHREHIKLLIVVCVVVLTKTTCQQVDGQLSDRVEKGVKLVSPAGVRSNNESELETINLEEGDSEEEEAEEDNERRFSWKLHQDDHSLYAHRALISTANIKRPELADDKDLGPSSAMDELENQAKGERSEESEELAALKTIDFAEKEWQLMFRSFDLMFDGASASLIQELGQKTNLLEEIIANLKPQCRRDIDHIRRSVKQHKLWALRMVDSIGKLPSGITYGRFSSPGDYEECLSVRVDERIYSRQPAAAAAAAARRPHGMTGKQSSGGGSNPQPEHHQFHGKYCLIDFRLPLPERPRDKLLSIHDPVIDLSKTDVGRQFPELANYSGYASVFYEIGYMHAVCLPSTCEVSDLTRSLGRALEGLHIIVNNTIDCEERPAERPAWRASQLIAASLLVLLFANAACASVMRYFAAGAATASTSRLEAPPPPFQKQAAAAGRQPREANGGWLEWARRVSCRNRLYSDCFSIQSNFERLSKPDPRSLTFVHYTRIVAMGLTVVTHTAAMGTLQAITKPADTSNSEQIFRDFIPQMLANAFTSIQIFFFMAGFMLVISTYPSIKREKGHVSFLEYAIKRAIRLMPGLAATICLNFLWPLLVDGPMLSYFVKQIMIPCESNWWRTMAFLSNFDHVEKMCLRHSYFSASDYQLHIMAFPLLILLYKQPNLSLLIAGILTCAGFAAQVIMILTKSVLPFMMVDYIDKEAFFNVVHYIHHPVWNHMSAFFYGFIIGYLVVRQIRINLSAQTIKRLWFTILPIGIASIFAPYFWNHYKRPIHRWQMVLYVLFDRFALLTACAWLSYATMVLARRPQPAARRDSRRAAMNLPNIIALASNEKGNRPTAADANQELEEETRANEMAANADTKQQPATWHLSPDSSRSAASLTRQRSSPNFQAYAPDERAAGAPTLRASISSSNVRSEAAAQEHSASRALDDRQQQPPPPSPGEAQVAPPPPPPPGRSREKQQAPISNVNTLCLILSRLTFQLYLFNMVVLWIDVNHSKYYWFFSYYFIITKSFAIYVLSSLMALVFFVTLESPSLTLYIMWVKSRAQDRANRSGAQSEPSQDAAGDRPSAGNHRAGLETSNRRATTNVGQSPSLARTKDGPTGSEQWGGSSTDGLSIRLGAPKDGATPSFSYIDLSLPTTNISLAEGTATSRNTMDTFQTKM